MAGEGMSKGRRTTTDKRQVGDEGLRPVRGRSSKKQAAAVTVGEVLALLDSGAEDSSWLAMHTVAGRLAAGRSNADDLIQEATMRAFARRAAALRRMDSSLSIRAWLKGVFGKLECEERRNRCTSRGATLAAVAEADGRGGAGTLLPGTIDLELARLTPKQREVLELRIEGITDRDGARRLSISRGAYRGRAARAIQNLRKADAKPASKRIWASLLLAQGVVPPNRMEPGEARRLLVLYARGYSHDAIAKKMCTTAASVKNRVKRWKSWWRKRRAKEKTRSV